MLELCLAKQKQNAFVHCPPHPYLALNLGRNKMVIDHLEKLFVTNDAATIIKALEVIHPAAKLLVMASQQQEAEVCSR
jgi:hypothetical protein